MDCIINNCYRILNASNDSSRKNLYDKKNKLIKYSQIYGFDNNKDILDKFNHINKNNNLIEDVYNELEKPDRRILNRIFWFNFTGEEITNIDTLINQCEVKLNENPNNIKYKHNLAIAYYLVFVLSLQENLNIHNLEEIYKMYNNLNNRYNINNFLGNWVIIFQEDFWNYIRSLESNSNYTISPFDEDYNELEYNLTNILINPIKNIIIDLLQIGDIKICKDILDSIKHTEFSDYLDDTYNEIEKYFTDEIYGKLNEHYKNFLEDLEDDISHDETLEICNNFNNTIKKRISRLEQFMSLIPESNAINEYRDFIAKCLNGLGVNGYHKINEFGLELKSYENATSYIVDNKELLNIINSNIEITSNIVLSKYENRSNNTFRHNQNTKYRDWTWLKDILTNRFTYYIIIFVIIMIVSSINSSNNQADTSINNANVTNTYSDDSKSSLKTSIENNKDELSKMEERLEMIKSHKDTVYKDAEGKKEYIDEMEANNDNEPGLIYDYVEKYNDEVDKIDSLNSEYESLYSEYTTLYNKTNEMIKSYNSK